METYEPFNTGEPEKKEESVGLIEKLEKKLYARTDEIKHKGRTKLNPKKFGSIEDWEDGGDMSYKRKEKPPHLSGYVKFFIFSFAFFLVAVIIAGYSFFSKRTVVSPDNVNVSLFGPVSLKGGEELALQVVIENKNEVPLNRVDIIIDFPKGSRYSNNPGKEIARYLKTIPSIGAKETRTETIKAVFMGEENQRKDLDIDVKFRIEGLGPSYTKNKTFSINLTSSPLSIKADILKEAIAGQDVTLEINIKSLSPSLVKNPILQIGYPKGFIFKSASPAPTSGDNFWNIGDMKFGEEKQFNIKGTVMGENEQEKVFSISAGIPNKDVTVIDTMLSSFSQGLTVKKPFLGITLFMNGSSEPEYILEGLGNVDISARWLNNIASRIIDGQITISVSGDMIDPKKVTPKGNGYYDASRGTIFWDSKTTASLASIEAGGENVTGLTLTPLPFLKEDGTVFKNPEISVGVSVKGKRISEANVPEEITSFVSSKIKIGTYPTVHPSILFHVGPFVNSGPVPFRVEKETTVTVSWKAYNSVNDISNARVTAVLPSYTRWTGNVSPNGADINYNPVSGEVSWNIGKMKAGTGYETEPNEIAFQVGVTPGLSQLEQIPTFVSRGYFTGKDEFTRSAIKENILSSQSYPSGDPDFMRDWLVVEE
jgi:hypothetical protein